MALEPVLEESKGVARDVFGHLNSVEEFAGFLLRLRFGWGVLKRSKGGSAMQEWNQRGWGVRGKSYDVGDMTQT